jgi:hypothetical protein
MCLDGSRNVIYVWHGNVKGYVGEGQSVKECWVCGSSSG